MNEFLNWYFGRYMVETENNLRFGSFLCALTCLFDQDNSNHLIVETACQTETRDVGGGESTTIFGNFCYFFGGKIISIDLPSRIVQARQAVNKYLPYIEFIEIEDYQANLSATLKELGQIDLLYLNSSPNNWEIYPKIVLEELRIIDDVLKENSVLLIDDLDYIEQNNRLVRLKLKEIGLKEIYYHQQGVFLKCN